MKLLRNRNLFLILVLGLVIRVALNDIVHSHDAVSFVIWARFLADNSVIDLYDKLPGAYPPYPPLYYYILTPIGKFMNFFSIFEYEWLSLLVAKLPVFTAEIVTTILIYKTTTNYVKPGHALIASAFYFLNPAVILITAVWGQIDSIVTAVVFCSLFLLIKMKVYTALLLFFCGLMLKLQTFAVLPLIAIYTLLKLRFKDYFFYLVNISALGILIVLPLVADKGLKWTLSFFYHLPGQYPYTSVYAYNVFSVFGFMKPDSFTVFGPVTLNLLGLILFFSFSSFIVYKYVRGTGDFSSLFLATFLLFFAFFLFNTRMHSRYLIYTLGFIAPFVLKYPKVAGVMTMFCLLNLTLPMTSSRLLPIATLLGTLEARILVVTVEVVVFLFALKKFISEGNLAK